MKNRYITILSILFATMIANSAVAFADVNDEETGDDRQKQWMQEYRQYKRDYLAKEISLEKDQQEEFFTLYTEMENRIYNINRDAKAIEQAVKQRTDEVSDEEYSTAAKAIVESKLHEAQVEEEYFNKFSKILNSKQLFLLKSAENSFSRIMLQHHRGKSTASKRK